MIRYQLIEPRTADGAFDGELVASFGCPKWKFRLIVSALDTSVDVKIQESPTGNSGSWVDLHDFGTIASTGTYEVVTYGTDDAGDTELPELALDTRYLRAIVDANVGEFTLSLTAEATILDLEDADDMALLVKDLREWNDGLRTHLLKAEEVLRVHLGGAEAWTGAMNVIADDPDFYGAVRMALASQANYSLGRYRREQKGEEVTGPVVAPDATALVRPYATAAARSGGGAFVWRGR